MYKEDFETFVEEADTAIPVFIGLTGKAQNGTESLRNKPVRISSMKEYKKYFGGPQIHCFTLFFDDRNIDQNTEESLSVKCGKKTLHAELKNNHCTLFYHLQLFFANGGDTCYIMSVGDYNSQFPDNDTLNHTILPALAQVPEITLLVMPEAAELPDRYADLYKSMLSHCAANNRFAILDVPRGLEIEAFRAQIGGEFLSYGAAYYPWLETEILSYTDITGEMICFDKNLILDVIAHTNRFPPLSQYIERVFKELDETTSELTKMAKREGIHKTLLQNLPEYELLTKKIQKWISLLPPSATVAGTYTRVDHTHGVWKAPANVALSMVNKPIKDIRDYEQEALNLPMDGKVINVIRAFPGDGTKVWGARTLDGNSQDWRYVNVRRTVSFLENLIRRIANTYVFEPNNADTWSHMKDLIEGILFRLWQHGGLAGFEPEEAYEVHVGVNDTMTPEDIQAGIIRISVQVAISRPADFFEISFPLQMQKR